MSRNSEEPRNSPWHSMEADQVMAELGAGEKGLSHLEVRQRLDRHGPNRLPEARRQSPLIRFLSQFNNVLIYVLLVAAVVTALLGHWIDCFVILGVVVVNALIGFIQEGKAEKALDSIRKMLSLQASVLREGRKEQVPAEELVPGDIVFLQSGDKVPADLRLIAVKELRIDESMLTGESIPTEKSLNVVPEQMTVGDRTNLAYSGTMVTSGQGRGIVIATGQATEIGRISEMLTGVEKLTTPLLQQIAAFARHLTVAIIILATGTFLFGLWARDYSAGDMFLAAVGLIVAAIPEGLPAIITITLAIGVQRMARRNAIIRRLPAVETLGAITVICSDKTGTLTRNEMTVRAVATADHLFDVDGEGYDPHGGFSLDGRTVDIASHPTLSEMGRAAILCNDAVLEEQDGLWHIQGDPTEGALLTMGLKMGLESAYENRQWPRTDLIPFESEHRFMATLHHNHSGHGFIYLKGAPEVRTCRLTSPTGKTGSRNWPAAACGSWPSPSGWSKATSANYGFPT
jgi:magnesium-transporting ATPase (P-type)